jgi:predicted anti-sigma-YlaC factor YlaD
MTDHKHQRDQQKCRAMLGDLSLYVDGEAGEALCDEIERHMAECEDCRVVVDTLAKTVKLYQEHGQTPLPGEARRRLFVALDLADFYDEGSS